MQKIKQYCARVALGLLCLLLAPGRVGAETAPLPVLIIEVQTASLVSGRDEFIELYNPNDTAVDVAGWQMQYRAAGKTGNTQKDWQQLVNTLACDASDSCSTVIPAYGRLALVSSSMDVEDALVLAKDGMATESGQLRLVRADGGIQDMVGYGQATTAEGEKPAPKLTAGKSLKRRVTEDGHFIDTDVNADDFIGGCTPTPQSKTLVVTLSCTSPSEEPSEDDPETEPTPEVSDPDVSEPEETVSAQSSLIITELLPDPAVPQQDAADEYIELYNPHESSVSLAGYALLAGSDFRYRYSFGAGYIAPHAYIAVRSAESQIPLSNSGGKVRLLDPDGKILDETAAYTAAKEGQAWMRDDAGWHWTTQPTPGAANILAIPLAALPTTKTSASKKPAKAAVAKAKTPVIPKATKKSTSPAAADKTPSPMAAAVPNPHMWLLIPIGMILLGYAVYEYRQDIARAIHKLRQKLGRRRTVGRQPLEDTS